MLLAELDDYCDKLVDERRSSGVQSTSVDDVGPVYHALSVRLSQAKSMTLSTIDMPKQSIQSPEFGTKFQREVPLYLEIHEFPFNIV